MSQRKPWTQQEDNALRYLKQQMRISKWSTIAQKMSDDYKMTGRSGKQCRQRYHNHLDASIVKTSWTKQEQIKLFKLHDQIGNKWALIAQQLPGRTDNCVKNHFYSKLRKSIRKLNKIIHDHFKKQYKEIKTTALYKIIQANQQRHKKDSMMDQDQMNFCLQLKNRLLNFSDDNQINSYEGNPDFTKSIINDIQQFSKMYKRHPKKTRRTSGQFLKVQDSIRPRVKSSQIVHDQSQQYQGSLFDQSVSDRSKLQQNEHDYMEGQKVNRVRSHSGQNYQNQFNPFQNLFMGQAQMKVQRPPNLQFMNFNPFGYKQQQKSYVQQNPYKNFINMGDSQQNMKMINSNGSDGRMIEQSGIQDCLKNANILQEDNNMEGSSPMIGSLGKDSSKFSNYSNQPDQHFLFQDSQFQIKTFGYNPYQNVKKLSFTQQILQEQ